MSVVSASLIRTFPRTPSVTVPCKIRPLALRKDLMAKKIGRLRYTTSAELTVYPFKDHAVENDILRSLPPKERKAVFSRMEFVEFPIRFLLNEIAEQIHYAYFVNSGLASILNVTSEGKSVEVGLTGREGFVGLPLLVGFLTSPTRAVTQIAGSAFRVSAKDMIHLFPKCPQLVKLLNRYSQEFALQVTQVAVCNRLHRVDQRLARWFLMSQDRMGGSSFLLTQEFLSHMLGTRRASVTVAAGVLHKAGLITYKRGKVTVKNRPGLEKASCECYAKLKRQLKKWHGKSR
jgi:CRP-like cAMP-binding protein